MQRGEIMLKSEILPVGSVVLLKNSTKRLMIIGLLQAKPEDMKRVYDYCGCVYPEGYMNPNNIYLFDAEQIEKVYYRGLVDEEQKAFETRIREILPKIYESQRKAEADKG